VRSAADRGYRPLKDGAPPPCIAAIPSWISSVAWEGLRERIPLERGVRVYGKLVNAGLGERVAIGAAAATSSATSNGAGEQSS